MYNTILFDLDGTLIDSLELILRASEAVHEAMQVPWQEAELLAMIGIPLTDIAIARVGQDRAQAYCDAYVQFYEAQHNQLIKLYPGVLDLLKGLKAQGFNLGAVTSRRRRGANHSLEFLGIKDFFAAAIVAEDTQEHKPNPEPVNLALARLDSLPEQSLFVGDSIFDIAAGNAAGVDTCGISWGAAEQNGLDAATYIIDDLTELSAILAPC